MSKINDINDLVNATFQVKKFFRDTKKKFNLNYEEIYILNHILRSESNEISSHLKRLLSAQSSNLTI